MLKKILACSIVSLFVVFGAVSSSMADNGPAEITLQSATSAKPKPAVFPHAAHQEALKDCGVCHHGMADGKQVAYKEGQEIKKCEECHNPDVLGGKMKGKLKLDTIKGAGHGKCLACHKEMAKKDKSKKGLKSCKTCHPKKS